jgi:hypothetical protein
MTRATTKCPCFKKYKDKRAKVVGERYDAMLQRCTNPSSPSWEDYGGRGIENKFLSREHYIRYILENLPHTSYRGVDIGRINNDGHYEPGNVRLETRVENLANRRPRRRLCTTS